jgi:hypothetical protein
MAALSRLMMKKAGLTLIYPLKTLLDERFKHILLLNV